MLTLISATGRAAVGAATPTQGGDDDGVRVEHVADGWLLKEIHVALPQGPVDGSLPLRRDEAAVGPLGQQPEGHIAAAGAESDVEGRGPAALPLRDVEVEVHVDGGVRLLGEELRRVDVALERGEVEGREHAVVEDGGGRAAADEGPCDLAVTLGDGHVQGGDVEGPTEEVEHGAGRDERLDGRGVVALDGVADGSASGGVLGVDGVPGVPYQLLEGRRLAVLRCEV